MRRPPLGTKVCAPVAPIACLVLGVALSACGQAPSPQAAETQSPIFGGTADTTHSAVMALIDQLSATTATACSGTTVALVGASGIFLTAGHCVVANDGMGHVTTPLKLADAQSLFVVPGPNWQQSVQAGLYYGVAQVAVHPQYDGSVNSPFDIAVVRFLGALPATPVIPALDPANDKLAVGTTIDVVGFGKTETNAMNASRFEVNRVIKSITANQFLYDQTDMKGACQGDSGGPALVDTPAGTRVAGVTSFGDPDCTMVGASVRVSPVFDSFVQSFANAAPRTLDCNDCALASVGPGNACVTPAAACATQSMPCGQFLSCADACTNASCVAACRQTNSAGANAFDAVVSCQCGGACQTVCANSVSCGGTGATCGGLSDPRAACDACIQGSCCNQAATCAADDTCASCFAQASSAACRLNTNFMALTGCLASCPGAPCSANAGTAGGAAGGSGTVVATGGGANMGQMSSHSGCDVAPSPISSAGLALLALAFAAARTRARRR
ncbi:MAG TPA: trypsin-like serine protease [Polyangia bacterium]|nr:trypsin-like serine protease [Polyangia bacterium]